MPTLDKGVVLKDVIPEDVDNATLDNEELELKFVMAAGV